MKIVVENINVSNDWECLGIIGGGGNSIVKKVKLKNQNYPNYLFEKNVDTCAIKIIESKKFVLKEIEILNKLKEINNLQTTKLLGYGKDEGNYYIFMELIDGTNLYDSIIHLSVEKKKKIIFQLVEILKSLHHNKVIHGDIKIQNILVNVKEKIKIWLVDYGNGHYYDRNDSYFFKSGGTIGHSSKRAIDRCSVGRKEDIFSFGVTVLLLMNGYNTPYDSFENDIIYKLPPDFPEGDLKYLIESCIDDDEDKRPTAEQLYEFNYIKSIQNATPTNIFVKNIFFGEFYDKLKSKLAFKSLKFGQSFGSRVLAEGTVFTSNKLYFNQRYIHMEDPIILLSDPLSLEIHNKIQVILIKKVVLKTINKKAPIQKITLPKGIHISILPTGDAQDKKYSICLSVTIEKPFYRKNEVVHFEGEIDETYFNRNVAYRYYAFSGHGFIFVKSQYIKKMDLEGVNDFYLFLMLLKILKQYFLPKNEIHYCRDFFKINENNINNNIDNYIDNKNNNQNDLNQYNDNDEIFYTFTKNLDSLNIKK